MYSVRFYFLWYQSNGCLCFSSRWESFCISPLLLLTTDSRLQASSEKKNCQAFCHAVVDDINCLDCEHCTVLHEGELLIHWPLCPWEIPEITLRQIVKCTRWLQNHAGEVHIKASRCCSCDSCSIPWFTSGHIFPPTLQADTQGPSFVKWRLPLTH